MKVYVVVEWPYHDNGEPVGVYSTEAKARENLNMLADADRIVEIELDAPAQRPRVIVPGL
jgi:hypothetical protein